jgi:hypothetical protein
MDWREALEIVVGRTGHIRYRELAAQEHPDHDLWRDRLVEMATGQAAPQYPPLAAQARSALGAAGRAVGAALSGAEVVRSGDEIARCLAICHACEHFVATDGRCSICGCVAAWKIRLATEHCPLDPPKW